VIQHVVAYDAVPDGLQGMGPGWMRRPVTVYFAVDSEGRTYWSQVQAKLVLDDGILLESGCEDFQHYDAAETAESVAFQIGMLDNDLIGRLKIVPCPVCKAKLAADKDGS